MLRKSLPITIISFSLIGCINLRLVSTMDEPGDLHAKITGPVKAKLIRQDKMVAQYKEKDLTKLQTTFPEYKLTKLNLVTQRDGINLQGLLLDNPNSQDVIFYIPGNGMKVSRNAMQVFKELSQLKKDIVFFDRRGTGASAGKATIGNLTSDSVEQLQFIRKQFTPNKIIVHGFSLGSFIAGQLVKSVEIDALVLQGSASNITDWYNEFMPWYIDLFVVFKPEKEIFKIDNKKIVTELYDEPLLVIGGEKDTMVPGVLSARLFKASKSDNKQLMLVENAGHRTMLAQPNEINVYKQFLASL